MSVIALTSLSIFIAVLAYSIQQWDYPLWKSILLAITLGYLPSYIETSPTTPKGRYWKWFAELNWRWLSPFLKKADLTFETPLTKEKQYLFAVHPHGMASWNHGILLCSGSTPKFRDIIPGEQRRHLGASIVFRLPLYREFLLFFGVVDASKRVANSVLKSGKTLVILVGGVIEQMMATRGEHLVYVKNRKGHCKLAIQHGVPVVPVYCFGETDMYDCSTFMLPFRQWIAKKYSIGLTLFSGPYWWFPMYPYDIEFHHVFGNPIETTKTAEPSQDEIDRVHQAYVDELERIFNNRGREMLQESKRRFGKTFRGASAVSMYKVDERIVDPRLGTNWLLPRQPGEKIRVWVARNLELSPLFRVIDALMVVLSFVMVFFFLYTNWNNYSIDLEPSIQTVSNVIGVLFTFDYVIRLYAAPLRFDHAKGVFSIVDIIGVASAWIEISMSNDMISVLKVDTTGRQFLSMLQIMKSLRILRAYRLLRFTSSVVQRQVLATILTIICMIIAVAGALQNLELCPAICPDECIPLYRNDTLACSEVEIVFGPNLTTNCPNFVDWTLVESTNKVPTPTNCCRCQVYRFLDWIYFVIVTMSTLGYGDISPKTLMGRTGTAALIMMAFVLVPIQVNRLVSVISQHSRYNKAYTAKNDTHGVITAHYLDVGMLHMFLRQFFHPENRNWNERIIILYPQEPTVEVTKIIHTYEPRVTYIVGSAMQETDLKRAAVPDSSVCYVLTSFSDTSDRADQMSSILTTAFRAANKTVPIFTQVIRSTSVSYCTISGANNVVCVQKLKMSMLALSCGIKGLTTMLSNLLTTLTPPLKPHHEPWIAAYIHGAVNKVFRVDIPRSFSGLTYHELVMFLYNNLQVIPIAMETSSGIQLNPMEFKLGQAADPKICCTVYMIAHGLEIVDRIAEYQLEQIRVFRQTLRKMERARDDAAGITEKPKTPKRGHRMKKLTLGGHMYTPPDLAKNPKLLGDSKSAYDLFLEKDLPLVLEKHIVIIGLPFALQDLLEPLRSKSDSKIIVVLSPVQLSVADFECLDEQDETYFFLGSPLSSFDLQRVGITSASSIIVLSTSVGKRDSFFDDNMVDADAITCVRFILEASSLKNRRPPNLIVDLVKHTNVRFLSIMVKTESRRDRRLTDRMDLQYAEDEVESVLDENEDDEDLSHICQSAYASGRVFVSGIIESLMSECYRSPNLPIIIDALLHGQETDFDKLQLFQVPCPKNLSGKTFGECFRRLLRLNYICIGCWHAERTLTNSSKRIPAFVHTNPKSDTEIDEKDLLYIIGKPTTGIEI